MRKFYLFLFLITLNSTVLFAQIYVTETGAGDNTGTSWGNAYSNTQLQTAINRATAGEQVWVAKGTYKPTEDLSTTNLLTDGITPTADRDKTFILKAAVEIYGGFAGGEAFNPTSIANRNLVLNETTLSGDLTGNDISDPLDPGYAASKTDNAYHVVSSRNTSAGAILDGFTIQHGFADGIGDITEGGVEILQNRGGAIAILGENTGATFRNLIIKDCVASGWAGGVWASGSSVSDTYVFEQVRFENNTAIRGGAAHISLSGGHTAVLSNCTFLNNSSTAVGDSDGAGALLCSGGEFNISNTLFKGNTTARYGGAMRINGGTVNITNTIFEDGNSISRGGAIYSTGSGTVNIDASTFRNNSSDAAGGHYYIFNGTVNVNNTTFENGSSGTSSGGVFYLGSSVVALNISGCDFISNKSGASAGVAYMAGGTLTATSSNFNGNSCANIGGVFYATSTAVALNISGCDFTSNTASDQGGVLYTVKDLNISKSRFYHNTATTGRGGALVIMTHSASPNVNANIDNSLFYNNVANESGSEGTGGGAIYLTRSTSSHTVGLTATNNTFYANKSPNSPHGAISFFHSNQVTFNLYNNIFNGNTGSDGSADIRLINTSIQNFSNNLFQVFNETAGTNDVFAKNEVNDNPTLLFASTTETDYNFLWPVQGGFSLDKGDKTLFPDADNAIDLLGNPRVNGVIDLGAIEWSTVLPVTISSFTANLANNRTQLKWSVGTEDNVNRYEVERSQNGTDFDKVAEVLANGSSSYTTADANPQLGVNYYRLKTIDNDGTHSYYGAIQSVKVTTLSTEGVKVYPNPVRDGKVNISLIGYPTGTYTYKLLSVSGLVVEQGQLNYDGSSATINLSPAISGGMYLLQLNNGEHSIQTKLIKQ